MSVIFELIQARGSFGHSSSHVHLSPGDLNAIWHLTQAIGRFFWHMSPAAQCVTVGVPSAVGMVGLAKWDPLVEKKQIKNKSRKRLNK